MNTEQLKKEFKMVLDDAFEDKSYLSDKPQMNEEDALFEQVLDVVWNFFLPHLISSDEMVKKDKTPRIDRECAKCNNTGWFSYDENHSQICPDCCPHDMGYWLLEEHYGNDNGKVCCLRGCGHKRDLSVSHDEIKREAVQDFANWCDSLSYEYEDSDGNAMVMEELVKTYLTQQSLDKGGGE